MYGLVVLEVLVRWMQGKPAVRVNSTITSLATGLMTSLVKVLVSTIDIGLAIIMGKRWEKCVFVLFSAPASMCGSILICVWLICPGTGHSLGGWLSLE